MRSIELDHCFVCGVLFTTAGGPANFFEHQHHLVPRAFGGVDGPRISLCSPHHTAVHQIALKLERAKPVNDLLTQDSTKDKKLLWLASIIVNAKAMTSEDPNKPMPIVFIANKETKEKLKQLKRIYKAPYGSLIQYAISSLYSKSFK